MHKVTSIGYALFILTMFNNPAGAAEGIRLDTYTCGQFLKDAQSPDNGTSLLRSMMIVSWATGYAAAHQTGTPRADAGAIELISAMLGVACQHSPNASVLKVASDTIDNIAQVK